MIDRLDGTPAPGKEGPGAAAWAQAASPREGGCPRRFTLPTPPRAVTKTAQREEKEGEGPAGPPPIGCEDAIAHSQPTQADQPERGKRGEKTQNGEGSLLLKGGNGTSNTRVSSQVLFESKSSSGTQTASGKGFDPNRNMVCCTFPSSQTVTSAYCNARWPTPGNVTASISL